MYVTVMGRTQWKFNCGIILIADGSGASTTMQTAKSIRSSQSKCAIVVDACGNFYGFFVVVQYWWLS